MQDTKENSLPDIDISVVLPCRNEEMALPFVLKEIKEVVKNNNLKAEIIVSDSSTDRSPDIALEEKVILAKHGKEGYGNAYLEGFKVTNGKYIIMLDADGSYDSKKIPRFIYLLGNGNDFVIGNRFCGEMEKGAMPFVRKYIGNPALSLILKVLFGGKIDDSQCGMRGIKKEALEKLNLTSTGMEFASEMIVKALARKFKIAETPVNYRVRIGESKLKVFRDGWRHLRFMILSFLNI
jgi:glycosyltransferase involved in cell wall biosynthesis